MQKAALCSLVFGLFVASTIAQQAEPSEPAPLQAGDTAPALQFSEWVKGSPITSFERGKVYLVEFWAVWCGPCIGSIPHLNALQQKYRKDGLIVIGFTSPDRTPGKPDRKEGNAIESVRDLVARRGDSMDYQIAYDLPDRATFKAYFNAPQAGIPHGFIVGRDGRVVVSGNPYYFDEVIADVMADRWDPMQGPTRFAELQRLLRASETAQDYTAFKHARAALKAFSSLYYERSIYSEILKAIEEGDAPVVNRVGEFMIRKALEAGEADGMSYMISQMVRRDPIKTKARPFLKLAGRMSEAYVTVTKARDSNALSLRADWFVCKGDLKSAVKLQRQALAVEVESRSDHLKARLVELERDLAAKGS